MSLDDNLINRQKQVKLDCPLFLTRYIKSLKYFTIRAVAKEMKLSLMINILT